LLLRQPQGADHDEKRCLAGYSMNLHRSNLS
jgi:hypothetical protein